MESVMEMQFEKEANNIKGKITFLRYGNKRINLVETKKGFSRGGHHAFESKHGFIPGLEYREKNLTDVEKTQTLSVYSIITTKQMTLHLIIAITVLSLLKSLSKIILLWIIQNMEKLLPKR